jgi:hypothetical protein
VGAIRASGIPGANLVVFQDIKQALTAAVPHKENIRKIAKAILREGEARIFGRPKSAPRFVGDS